MNFGNYAFLIVGYGLTRITRRSCKNITALNLGTRKSADTYQETVKRTKRNVCKELLSRCVQEVIFSTHSA